MLKFIFCPLFVFLLSVGMGGCGLQGGLESPNSSQKSGSASSETDKEKDEKEDAKTERKFFLDRLLR